MAIMVSQKSPDGMIVTYVVSGNLYPWPPPPVIDFGECKVILLDMNPLKIKDEKPKR